MQIGLLTDSLSTLTRAEALDTAAELGLETVEIGLGGPHGGWSPAPHADLIELLNDSAARTTLRRDITSRGLRLEAFNAAGNPLHPVSGDRDDQVLRSALQLAEGCLDHHGVAAGEPPTPGTSVEHRARLLG